MSSASVRSSSTSARSRSPPAPRPVDASVGVGELVITVPEGVALEIDAHAGVGEIDIVGERDDGVDVDRDADPAPARRRTRRCSSSRPTSASAASRYGEVELDVVPAAPRPPAPPARGGRGALAGVCAGIAKSLRVDPTLVRLTFAMLAFAGGAGVRRLRRRLARARAGERPDAVATPAAARLRRSRDRRRDRAPRLRVLGLADLAGRALRSGDPAGPGPQRRTPGRRPLARRRRRDRLRRPERDVERPRRGVRVERGRDRAAARARAVGVAARRRAGRRAHRADPLPGALRDGGPRARLRPPDARARPARGR